MTHTISSYILHFRPRSWPIVALHTFAGAVLAWFMDMGGDAFKAVAGGLIWAIFLNGGTLALNSAIDQDEGDVGYLDNPPPVPPRLGIAGVAVMLAGAFFSWLINPAFFCLYLFNVLLSILYSVPPVRFKARAGADVCINALGYGLSTFMAGWFSQTGGADGFALLIGLGFAFLFAGFYPYTQIYQYNDDVASGAHTLTVALGINRVLVFASICIHLAFFMFISGFIISGKTLIPLVLLGLSWALWIRLNRHWPRRTSLERQKAGMYEALYIWALTDCMILLSALG